MNETETNRVRHYTFLEQVTIALIGVAVVIGMLIAAVSLVGQGDIKESQRVIRRGQRQQVCFAKFQSDFMAAVGDALAAPPAPNPDRFIATEQIEMAARRLKQVGKVCK